MAARMDMTQAMPIREIISMVVDSRKRIKPALYPDKRAAVDNFMNEWLLVSSDLLALGNTTEIVNLFDSVISEYERSKSIEIIKEN